MDFNISPDDRVGGGPSRGKAAPGRPKKPKKGERLEPQLAMSPYADEDEKPRRKPKRTRKERRRRGFSLGGIFITLVHWGFVASIWGGVVVAGIVVYYAAQMPGAESWAVPERPANIRIVSADGQLISNRGQMGGEAVSYRELPHYVPAAVLSIEDKRFMSHFGVDPIGIVAAALDNLNEGRVARGGSTITQQLAKNLFLTPDQTLGRKVQEALLALWLEQNYSKEQILELYLNRVYFGAGAYGIEAAAQRYFGKSARNLALGEAAILAGVLQAPSRLAPTSNPEGAAARARVVLNEMAAEGYISREEAQAAAIDPDRRIRTRVAGAEYYVADWVESLMTAYLGEVKEDVIVSTTIDWDLQKHAEFVVREMVAKEGSNRGFTQGALVAMEVDGTVRALVGGTDYAQSQFNRAVTSRRQPGSAFKPFVYLAAMEKGYTPDTIAEDAPFTYEGWSPENASRRYVGPVTLRDGLAYSMNTIAGRLAIDVTPQVVIDTAQRLGISTPMLAVPSIALGTSEVSLLELTAAYAPFANGGNGVIANVITRIQAADDGEILYEASQAGPGQVISSEVVGEMNDMMVTALEVGTGKGASLNGWPIAGKTGTSQNARDAVFVGYSARMVTGVWLGNDDNSATTLSGGNVPVDIWSQFMTKAHEGMTVAELPGSYTRMAEMPQDIYQQPVQQQPVRETRTIVDLIGDLFGGR
ncbi:PBP1A family penicillin-binding protein [Arsenicitalea aurantiaca]|uniref:PBP1A family penicillin-binding protein n=1 Tax=Arsenicitalea aurantiaca TaxID=1783274 RepID=A0A433X856_9HYPH|nr:PBP1A family penicillin-binding protein [Arsenicitalea aurantiaca]RUT30256.1 PBP1A family penicillin-binding protein [Arsenicitalea aurantiaca]